MGLSTAQALYEADRLHTLHLDAVVPSGFAALSRRGFLGHRARRRTPPVPHSLVRSHPEIFFLARWRRRLLAHGHPTTTVDDSLVRAFRRVSRTCRSPYVFGMESSSRELFSGERACRIMEQFSPPLLVEKGLLRDEAKRFPGWTVGEPATPVEWDSRVIEEWRLADVIWIPAPHLVDKCVLLGAERPRFRVVPYPIPRVPQGWRVTRDPPPRSRPLRVVFAGTLELLKGIGYLYEALAKGRMTGLDLHFFGPPRISNNALAQLAEVGTVHGAVPHAQLLQEFRRADVLLFPSLSEGSALVTLEAAATGLPILATRESGGPASAMTFPARSAGPIREALDRVLDDRSTLAELSERTVREAMTRTQDAFKSAIHRMVEEAVPS